LPAEVTDDDKQLEKEKDNLQNLNQRISKIKAANPTTQRPKNIEIFLEEKEKKRNQNQDLQLSKEESEEGKQQMYEDAVKKVAISISKGNPQQPSSALSGLKS
jgi:hypothetical protein